MLREGIARAKASLREREASGSKGGHGKRRREQKTEAQRLSELDLGEGSSFAELAETCLDLQEGVSGGSPVRDAGWLG